MEMKREKQSEIEKKNAWTRKHSSALNSNEIKEKKIAQTYQIERKRN